MRHLIHELAAIGPTAGAILRELRRSVRRGLAALIADAARTPRPIRVGVDIRPFYEPLTGVGWYLYEILQALSTDETVELVAFGDARVTDDGPALHVELPQGMVYRIFDLTGRPQNRWTHLLASIAFPLMMKLEAVDLFFGGNYTLPRALDAVARRRVITVHDLTYRKLPDLLQEETLANLESAMTRELARADAVICVSNATRRDLIEAYEIDDHRVFAIQNGLNLPVPTSMTDELDLPPRYVLFVSTIEPRKGLDTLIDAFELIRDRRSYDGDLVVAGRIGWKAEQTAARLGTSRWAAAIHHLDYVPRNHLDEIYRRAEVFVLPSLYEGFGFPVLEAMAHHVPVITTNVSSLPEVGGEAALYFEPGDAEGLASAIERVTSDRSLRKRMIQDGQDQAHQFQWSRASSETRDVFTWVADR